jgi:uncharacterized coiled-coil DUF342 family protein
VDAYQQKFEGVKQKADGLIMANEGVKKIADGAIAAKQERDGLHGKMAELRETVQQLQTLVLQQTQEIRQLREQIGGNRP